MTVKHVGQHVFHIHPALNCKHRCVIISLAVHGNNWKSHDHKQTLTVWSSRPCLFLNGVNVFITHDSVHNDGVKRVYVTVIPLIFLTDITITFQCSGGPTQRSCQRRNLTLHNTFIRSHSNLHSVKFCVTSLVWKSSNEWVFLLLNLFVRW